MNYKEKWKLYDYYVNNRLISKETKRKFLEQWKRDEEAIKLHWRKQKRKQTVKKNIEKKRLNWYVTLTINPEWKDRGDLRKLQEGFKKMFKHYEIDYYLVPEFHSDGVSYHFHGFIGSENMDLFENSGRKDRFHNEIYYLKPFSKNYGMSGCIRIDGKDERQKNKIINYIVKYMIKGNIKAMSSRSNFALKRLAEKVRLVLGDIVQILA